MQTDNTLLSGDGNVIRTTNAGGSTKLWCIAIIVTLSGSFHFGFQQLMVNSASSTLRDELRQRLAFPIDDHLHRIEMYWAALQSALFVGAAIGAAISHLLLSKMGRRHVLIINATLAMISLFPMALLPSITITSAIFFISRFGMGVVVGIGGAVQAIYLNEVAPRRLRGSFNVLTHATLQTSRIVAAVIAQPTLLGAVNRWQNLYLLEMAVALCHLIAVCIFCYETPAYFVLRGSNYRDSAISTIKRLHNVDDDIAAQVYERIDTEHREREVSWRDILNDRSMRFGLIMGVLVQCANAFSGISVMSMFSVIIMQRCGIDDRTAATLSIVIMSAGLLAIGILVYTVELFGRRTMVLTSVTALAVANYVLCVIGAPNNSSRLHSYFLVGSQLVVVCAWCAGVGPIAWFISVELVPIEAKSACQSLSSFTTLLIGIILSFVFLPIYSRLNALTFLLFAVPLTFLLIIFTFKLPETRCTGE